MNTMSGSRAERSRTLVWDAPVRVFHWLLAISFAVAYLTAESERWRLAHVTAGYTMGGLVAFRLVWGVVGTRHARFADFVRGPRAVLGYARATLTGQPQHHAGHNPAGALAIIGLLLLAVLTAASGWATLNGAGGHWLEEVHETLANGMLALVVVHVAAVLLSSWLHRENLIGAMIHGRKPVPAQQGIRNAWRSVAVLVLSAVLGFWWLQWQQPAPADGLAARSLPERVDRPGHDDD